MLKGEGEAGHRRAARGASRGDRGAIATVPGVVTPTARDRRRISCTASTTCGPRAISCAIAASTSSACSTPAPRSSSRAAAPGTARSAAPGRSTAAAIGWSARSAWSRTSSSIREPGVFIVDDVAFIQDEHGFAIGEAIARKGIRKNYYLETRGDVLLRNKEVFQFWKKLGVTYMFLGIEAIDEEGLRKFRKRIPLGRNFEALEFARSLGIDVAINIIADPDWDEERFRVVREWCLDVPEIVNISINTPYPGTETWLTEQRRLATRDYRLFDIQHAVLPTKLPLEHFYRELLHTQRVLYTQAPELVDRAAAGRARSPATCCADRPISCAAS